MEDWNRCTGAEGHLQRRRAVFSSPALKWGSVDNGVEERRVDFEHAMFTKVEDGSDEYAKERALGGVDKGGKGFFLSTGGKGTEDGTVLKLEAQSEKP